MVILFSIILGVLPSLVWLVFFLKEDDDPEPKKMILKTFIYGFFIVFIALIFQKILKWQFNFLAINEYSFVSFLIFSAIEEILKFSAAYFAVAKSKFFNEPVDAMIYAVTAALGFAAAENIFASLGIAGKNGINGVFTLLVFRFIGATLLHSLNSGIVGYYWGRGLLKINPPAGGWKLEIVKGLIVASVLHAVFNYLILISNKDVGLLIYSFLFLIIIALFVFKDFDKIKK